MTARPITRAICEAVASTNSDTFKMSPDSRSLYRSLPILLGACRAPGLSSSGTWATDEFRFLGDMIALGDVSGGGVLAAGPAFGVGERPEFPGPVVADGVDPDDLAVFGQLH
jgi:hypothetical protein